MANISDEEYLEPAKEFGAGLGTAGPFSFGQDLADRECVEQTLGRVLVLTVTPVDDAHVGHVTAHL